MTKLSVKAIGRSRRCDHCSRKETNIGPVPDNAFEVVRYLSGDRQTQICLTCFHLLFIYSPTADQVISELRKLIRTERIEGVRKVDTLITL